MDKWYEVPGKAGTNVIYSRVRLVRNLKEYPFPGRLTKEQSAELSEKLLGGLTGIASMDRMQYRFTHLERMGDLEKTALLERRAINRSVMKMTDIVADQRIKHAVAVRASEPAVLYKFLISRSAGRAHDAGVLFIFFLRLLGSKKSGEKFS